MCFERHWTTCYSKLNNQRNWEEGVKYFYNHSKSTRIFTLIMKDAFIRALKTTRKAARTSTWVCKPLVLIRVYFPCRRRSEIDTRTCMASSAKNKSFCEVPKYVINTRPHNPKLMKFTCYTHAQSCNTESCITNIAIQLPKVD